MEIKPVQPSDFVPLKEMITKKMEGHPTFEAFLRNKMFNEMEQE